MDWRVKGLVQKALGLVPGGMAVNDLLQRSIGGLQHFSATVDEKVDDWVLHQGRLESLDIRAKDKRLLEIGSGWFPTFPLCYALVGAAEIFTYDLTPHMSWRHTQRLLELLEAKLERIADVSGSPIDEVRERHRILSAQPELRSLLRAARIHYHAPGDATRTALAAATVDIVFSNSVLEHVTTAVLDDFMVESKRILKPDGIVLHSINCADHYAYFDRNINFMNYLQYDERTWAFWNTPMQYQNRLRPKDFVAATERAGLEILLSEYAVKPDLLAALPSMRIAPEFASLPPEELAAKSIDIIARR